MKIFSKSSEVRIQTAYPLLASTPRVGSFEPSGNHKIFQSEHGKPSFGKRSKNRTKYEKYRSPGDKFQVVSNTPTGCYNAALCAAVGGGRAANRGFGEYASPLATLFYPFGKLLVAATPR